MNKSILSIILAASAVLATGVSAQTVPLSTLSKPSSGAFQSGLIVFNFSGAMIFTTGSQDLDVTSISAQLVDVSPNPQPMITHLYLAPGGVPTGAPVYDTWLPGTFNAGLFTFAPATSLTLQPNTEYAFSIFGTAQLGWAAKSMASGFDAEPGWSMAGITQGTGPNPTSWNPINTDYFAGGAINSVPEPSTWALLGSGVVGLLGLRRRPKN